MKQSFFSLLMYLIVAFPTYAATLFDEPWVPGSTLSGGPTSIAGVNEQSVARDFTATDDWQILTVGWTGVFKDTVTINPTRDFIIDFFVDVSGFPAEFPFASFPVVASSSSNGEFNESFDAYNFTATLSSTIDIAQGTILWVSITDNGPDRSGSNGMGWSTRDSRRSS